MKETVFNNIYSKIYLSVLFFKSLIKTINLYKLQLTEVFIATIIIISETSKFSVYNNALKEENKENH